MWRTNKSVIPKEKCFVSVTEDVSQVKRFVHSLNVPCKVELISQESPLDSIYPLSESYSLTCSLLRFLQPGFLDTFVRGRETCLLVSQSRLEHEDSFAIINGILYMCLTKSTFEQAGLSGQKSKLEPSRYLVRYDLRDPTANEGQNRFDRLVWSLSNTTLQRKLQFLLSVSNASPNELLVFLQDCEPIKLPVNVKTCLFENVIIPSWQLPENTPSSQMYKNTVFEEWVTTRLEWAALVALGSEQILAKSYVDSYLSQYTVVDAAESGTISLTTLGGSTPLIPTIVDALCTTAVKSPWSVLNIYGYENTPVAWKEQEHAFLGNGLNHLCIFKSPNGIYTIIKLINGKDLTA
jgi:ribonuclease P/MRP protein subunit RPP40